MSMSKIIAWFEIVGGAIILAFGIFLVLWDFFSGKDYDSGLGSGGLFLYLPLGVWLYAAGRLLLQSRLAGKIMSAVGLLILGAIIAFLLSITFIF